MWVTIVCSLHVPWSNSCCDMFSVRHHVSLIGTTNWLVCFTTFIFLFKKLGTIASSYLVLGKSPLYPWRFFISANSLVNYRSNNSIFLIYMCYLSYYNWGNNENRSIWEFFCYCYWPTKTRSIMEIFSFIMTSEKSQCNIETCKQFFLQRDW